MATDLTNFTATIRASVQSNAGKEVDGLGVPRDVLTMDKYLDYVFDQARKA